MDIINKSETPQRGDLAEVRTNSGDIDWLRITNVEGDVIDGISIYTNQNRWAYRSQITMLKRRAK